MNDVIPYFPSKSELCRISQAARHACLPGYNRQFEVPYLNATGDLVYTQRAHIVGPICNNFEKNRAFYDKSMKLGTWLVDNITKKLRVSATPKMSSNGRHLVFSKMAALFIIISLFICKHHVFIS